MRDGGVFFSLDFSFRALQMADFEVYVDDDRYSVPSLYLITAQNDARARALAEEMWRSSEHHQGVELRRGGERLSAWGSLASADRRAGQWSAPGPTG